MNYRQLKKQYKRKHGFNPPKGYSRSQIRRGIKLNSWYNAIETAGYMVTQGFEAGIKAAQTAVKHIAARGEPISLELQAMLKLNHK